jgi:hypothetical protein
VAVGHAERALVPLADDLLPQDVVDFFRGGVAVEHDDHVRQRADDHGARTATPSKRPSMAGRALAVAEVAPVLEGTKFWAAARPRRRSGDAGGQVNAMNGIHRSEARA